MFVRLFHLTIEAIDFTALASVFITLKLEGGVPNMIPITEHRLQTEQNGSTFIEWQIGSLNVSRKGIHPIRNTPDMHIVNVVYL